MSKSRPRRLAGTDLFDYGPGRSRLLVRLWRELAASGRALDPAAVAAAVRTEGVSAADAEALLGQVAERDAAGRVEGLLGLSLREHPHRFEVHSRVFSTWCAVDTLFLPAMLGAPARVASESPISGRPVSLGVDPSGVRDVSPTAAAVSLPLVDPGEADVASVEGIQRTFCRRACFFADAEEGRAWAAAGRRAVEVVSIDDAWRHARVKWSSVLRHAGAMDAPAL